MKNTIGVNFWPILLIFFVFLREGLFQYILAYVGWGGGVGRLGGWFIVEFFCNFYLWNFLYTIMNGSVMQKLVQCKVHRFP